MGPEAGVAENAGPAAAAGPRPLRADAQRNRASILEAAEAVFAAEGIEVPVDVIAEKAGVGVGTLYRHFPTKETLCEAIVLNRLTALLEQARALSDAENPAESFFGFMEHFVSEGCAKRDLMIAMSGAGIEFDRAVAPIKEELRVALDVLLRRAQAVGAVRADVTAAVVMALAGATCQASSHLGPTPSSEMLGVIFDGLRPQPA